MAGEREATQTSGKKAASNGKGPDASVSDVERLVASQAGAEENLGGFERVVTEVDAFYRPVIEMPIPGVDGGKREVKCTLRGIPVEKRRRPMNPNEPEKQGWFYLVRTTHEMLAVTEKTENVGGVIFKEVVAMKPGQIVWVDERYDFRMLDRCIPHYDENLKKYVGAEVFAKPLEKINLRKGGRTKWRFDLRARPMDGEQLKAYGFGGFGSFSERRALPGATVEADVEGEEVPFG